MAKYINQIQVDNEVYDITVKNVAQTLGSDANALMSQRAVTDVLSTFSDDVLLQVAAGGMQVGKAYDMTVGSTLHTYNSASTMCTSVMSFLQNIDIINELSGTYRLSTIYVDEDNIVTSHNYAITNDRVNGMQRFALQIMRIDGAAITLSELYSAISMQNVEGQKIPRVEQSIGIDNNAVMSQQATTNILATFSNDILQQLLESGLIVGRSYNYTTGNKLTLGSNNTSVVLSSIKTFDNSVRISNVYPKDYRLTLIYVDSDDIVTSSTYTVSEATIEANQRFALQVVRLDGTVVSSTDFSLCVHVESVAGQKIPNVRQTAGSSTRDVMSQKIVTEFLSQVNDNVLRQLVATELQIGKAYNLTVGNTLSMYASATSAATPILQYDDDIVIYPGDGYYVNVGFIDDSNIVTSYLYHTLRGEIPAGQRAVATITNAAGESFDPANAEKSFKIERKSFFVSTATFAQYDKHILKPLKLKYVYGGRNGDTGVPYFSGLTRITNLHAFPLSELTQVEALTGFIARIFFHDENMAYLGISGYVRAGTPFTYEDCIAAFPLAKYIYIVVYASDNSNIDINNMDNMLTITGAATYQVTLDAEAENLRIHKSTFDNKYQIVGYSQVEPGTIINTAEHYLYVAQTPGFDGIKGDVYITSDNYLVMCHDDGFTFDENGRITTFDDSNKTLIRNMTYAEVMSLEHAKMYDGKYVHPTDIDTLLRICKRYGKFPYVTIRDTDMDLIAPILVDKLRKYNLEAYCIVNSFTYESLQAVRKLSPTVMLSHVQAADALLTKDKVVKVMTLGNAVVTLFDSEGINLQNETQLEALAFAKEQNVRIWNAIVGDADVLTACLEAGFAGCQSYIAYI